MKKKRRVNKRSGVLISLEDVLDVLSAIRHSMWTEEHTAIEYMRKGIPFLGMRHYKQLKELNEMYRKVEDVSRCTYDSWRRVGWYER